MRLPRRTVPLVLAAACAIGLAAGPLAGGASSQPAAQSGQAANPLAGDGMWIWYVNRSSGGRVGTIANPARRYGIDTVLIKSGDGTTYWKQFSGGLVSALKARGLRVCAWQFIYGRNPAQEARTGAAAVSRGADCLVLDVEGHYEGRY